MGISSILIDLDSLSLGSADLATIKWVSASSSPSIIFSSSVSSSTSNLALGSILKAKFSVFDVCNTSSRFNFSLISDFGDRCDIVYICS